MECDELRWGRGNEVVCNECDSFSLEQNGASLSTFRRNDDDDDEWETRCIVLLRIIALRNKRQLNGSNIVHKVKIPELLGKIANSLHVLALCKV